MNVEFQIEKKEKEQRFALIMSDMTLVELDSIRIILDALRISDNIPENILNLSKLFEKTAMVMERDRYSRLRFKTSY